MGKQTTTVIQNEAQSENKHKEGFIEIMFITFMTVITGTECSLCNSVFCSIQLASMLNADADMEMNRANTNRLPFASGQCRFCAEITTEQLLYFYVLLPSHTTLTHRHIADPGSV